MNPDDPWDFEAWSVWERLVVAWVVGSLALAVVVGWAVFPILVIDLFLIIAGLVTWVTYQEMRKSV